MELYEVGGCIRDEILGKPSKDIDFSVVLTEADEFKRNKAFYGRPSLYDYMVSELESRGIKVIRDKEGVPVGAEYFTVRGIAPSDFPLHPNRALDFVLARKDGEYSDGRRPDSVEPGTLLDDLSRRDFTMNAIAKATDGTLIDPFNGVSDINRRLIRAVGNPKDRLMEDALRAVRALRFSVTKNMTIEGDLQRVLLWDEDVADALVDNIADERIAEELSKMLRYDTLKTLHVFKFYPLLTGAMFSGKVSLDSTLKQKGRGK